MKRRTGITLVAITAVIVLMGVAGWKILSSKMKSGELNHLAPRLMIAAMNIRDISKENIKMDCSLKIDNPLPVTLSADSLRYEVWVDSIRLLRDVYPKSITVNKKGNSTVTLPLEFNPIILKNLVEKYDRQDTDSADYTVRTNFRLNVPVAGKREFNLKFTKRLPALRKITAKSVNVDIAKLGLKDSKLNIATTIINYNSFPINIDNGKYSVTVDKDLTMNGVMQKNIRIPAKGSQRIDMSVDLKTAKMPKVGWKMLFERKKTNFNMKFTGRLKTESEMLNNAGLNYNINGTLEQLKELAKATAP